MGQSANGAGRELREVNRWRRGYREARTNADGRPPTPDEITDMVLDRLAAADRTALADRIAADPDAAHDFRWLADLHREARDRSADQRPDEAAVNRTHDQPPARTGHRSATPATPEPARRRLRRITALAAALLLSLLGGLSLYRHTLPLGPDVLRSAADAEVRPAPGADLEQPPESLTWPEQAGATAYRVTLRDHRAQELWTSRRLDAPRADLPASLRSTLATGGSFLWTVQVEGETARKRLGPYTFRVTPR